MYETLTQRIDAFQQKYESLSGVVHRAKTLDELIQILMNVFAEKNATHVATADLPEEWLYALADQTAPKNITVYAPPYLRSDLPKQIDDCQVGVTKVEMAVADTGCILEFTTRDDTRLISTAPDTHIAIVDAKSILVTLPEAAPRMRLFFQENPNEANITTISGPSRSGDIEMKLTLGVHGPIASHVIIFGETE